MDMHAWVDIRLFIYKYIYIYIYTLLLSLTLTTRIDTNQSYTSDILSHNKTHGCRPTSLLILTGDTFMLNSTTNAEIMIIV